MGHQAPAIVASKVEILRDTMKFRKESLLNKKKTKKKEEKKNKKEEERKAKRRTGGKEGGRTERRNYLRKQPHAKHNTSLGQNKDLSHHQGKTHSKHLQYTAGLLRNPILPVPTHPSLSLSQM